MASYRISGFYDAKFLYDNAGDIAKLSADWVNAVDFSPETKDITWEGSGKTAKITFNTGLSVKFTADSYHPDIKATLFATPAITTSLPSGVAKRYLNGTTAARAGVKAGFEAYMTMIDESTGDSIWGRVVVPVGTLTEPAPPQGVATVAKATHVFDLTAKQTAVDVAGAAITGVTGDGVTWYFDVLSASSAS